MTNWALHVEQLTVSYEKTPVLWNVDLSLPQGVMAALVGPNGAGKSTLLQTILGMLRPLSGCVKIFGKGLKESRSCIAYVPQRESVDWDFPITVEGVVLMGRYRHMGLLRWARRADYSAALRCLEMVGMESFRKRQISQLSGGQQQRVFLARSLMQDADLYLLDEPFAGVDAASEELIVAVLSRLRDEGKTLFVVHHDLATVTRYFDYVVMLNTHVMSAGPVSSVFHPEAIQRTYGTQTAWLGAAAKLSQSITSGLN